MLVILLYRTEMDSPLRFQVSIDGDSKFLAHDIGAFAARIWSVDKPDSDALSLSVCLMQSPYAPLKRTFETLSTAFNYLICKVKTN